MCICKDVKMGSYDVAIPVWYDNRKRVVGIDICLVLEVLELWKKGIVTIESCCGHNQTIGYIAVDSGCVSQMRDLGYKQIEGLPANCFTPKKILN